MRKEDKGGGIMERLTIDDVIEHCKRKTKKYENLNGINTLETADISLSFIKEYWEHRQVKEYLEELKRYRDLEEQGLLFRLPCKIGDTIYEVSYENREFVIKEHIVKEFIYRAYRFPRIEIYCENENGFLACNNIGKLDECLFLTKAEAKQKLKEMESD